MNVLRPVPWILPALLLVSCSGNPSLSQSVQSPAGTATVAVVPYSEANFAGVLKSYVNDQGQVNYAALQTQRQGLDQYNASIGGVSPDTYEAWNPSAKIAFLINAYNSFTLQSIIDQNPLKNSIRDIPGVWKGRQFAIAGEQKTLDNIEHQTLRALFKEPRIHMALVCAAKSCPFLRNEPFTANRLDQQLDDQSQKFLSSDRGLRIDRQQNKVYLSSIFKWFGEDWKPGYGIKDKFTGSDNERAVLNFVSRYVSDSDRSYLEAGKYQIDYLSYDWSLNRQ